VSLSGATTEMCVGVRKHFSKKAKRKNACETDIENIFVPGNDGGISAWPVRDERLKISSRATVSCGDFLHRLPWVLG
jgi:hypothetical protein